MTIAIFGGGILGCCTALELADRGHRVVVFERNDELLSEASLHNEGKLHLGYVYAADTSFRTAARMIRGASEFLSTLSRWVPTDRLQAMRATTFDYVVHRDTMVSVADIESHFARVAEALDQVRDVPAALAPLDVTRPAWRRLSGGELETRYNPAIVTAAYETNEIAVDPWVVADALRDAMRAHPRVELRMDTHVLQAADRTDGTFDVHTRANGDLSAQAREGPFSAVVNALWANRPAVDARYGVTEPAGWYTRRKLGVNVLRVPASLGVPSFTIMLGPFGDVVAYPSGRVYMSWYPDCMIGTTSAVEETDWGAALGAVDHASITRRTIAALAALCPTVALIDHSDASQVVVNGGSIFAHGSSDIDDPVSRLHERIDAGPVGSDRYLSVDTSKFTLGPAMALATADRLSARVPVVLAGAA